MSPKHDRVIHRNTKLKDSQTINQEKPGFLGSPMNDGIPTNSYLAQWTRRRKRRLLYPHPKLSPGSVPL